MAARHGFSERMQRCWGGGAGFRLDETKASVAQMLQVGWWVGGVGGGGWGAGLSRPPSSQPT